jgi:hypothetical protein
MLSYRYCIGGGGGGGKGSAVEVETESAPPHSIAAIIVSRIVVIIFVSPLGVANGFLRPLRASTAVTSLSWAQRSDQQTLADKPGEGCEVEAPQLKSTRAGGWLFRPIRENWENENNPARPGGWSVRNRFPAPGHCHRRCSQQRKYLRFPGSNQKLTGRLPGPSAQRGMPRT